MKNLFESDNYPDGVPSELFIGSRWAWKNSEITAVYPTSTYTLSFLLTSLDSTHNDITLTASKVSSEHIIEIGQSTTSGYSAADYSWKAIIVRDSDSEEITVSEGFTVLKPEAGDIRTHTYKVLQAIRATIENTATKEQSSYSIAGRSLSRRTIEELTQLEQEYLRRWESEKAQIDQNQGRVSKHKVTVKMSA